MSLFANAQAGLSFPVALSEKYRPRLLNDFIGLEKPKRIMQKFAENPYPSAWIFYGASGTGKSTMATALANVVAAEMHHIGSQTCNLETIENVVRICHYMPTTDKRFHIVVCDEFDKSSKAAQLFLLSKLDSTSPVPNTIWIFTANTLEGLEDRFLSRCRQIEFSSHGLARETAQLLETIWERETGEKPEGINLLRLVQNAHNNVRESLMSLETELLSR